jgi:hypothetical protein
MVFCPGPGFREVSGHADSPPGPVMIWIQVRDVRTEHAGLAAAGPRSSGNRRPSPGARPRCGSRVRTVPGSSWPGFPPATRCAATRGRRWACASKRPSAGGNIGGRRRADLVAQDFDLYGWRCACCGLGGRGGGSAHREKLFGRDAETCGMYRWLRDNGLPEGFQILCLSCNESKGTGERCTLAYRQQEALLCL